MEFRPLVVAVSAFLLTAVSPQSLPEKITAADSGQPLWISAASAVTPAGALRTDVFGETPPSFDRMYGRGVAERKASDAAISAAVTQLESDQQCKQLWSAPLGDYEWYHSDRVVRSNSTAALAAHAIGIYEGTVSAIASGFAGQQPGTLAALSLTRTIKASPDVDTSAGLLVFHDYARFATGQYTFCVGYRPLAAGDHVLLFVLRPPADAKRQLIFDNDQIVIEHASKLSLPSTPASSELRAAKTLGDVRRMVEREVRHAR